MPLRICASLLLLLATACRPDNVELAYRFEEGSIQTFRMTAHAEAEWDIAEGGRGSYDISFDVTETVESVDENGSVVVVVDMVPTGAEENGLPSPGLERRSFSLRLGPNGELLEVLRLDGVQAANLEQDELAFIGTYRPSLPEDRVRLGDEWSQEHQVQLGSNFQQIRSRGELTGFRRTGDHRLARIEFTGQGPLEWLTGLPQGQARLTGEASTDGSGLFDIDAGVLEEATSSTRGTFDVRVSPGEGEAPIVGTLQLDLELTVVRVS